MMQEEDDSCMTCLEWNVMLNYHVHTWCKFSSALFAPPFVINLILFMSRVHINIKYLIYMHTQDVAI